MKKILAALLLVGLVIVLAYGGASYWVGEQALKQHDLLIAQINRSDWVEALSKSYERGLFRSTALTTVTVSQPAGGDSIKFGIISSIHHGPLVFLQNQHLKGSLHPALAVIHSRLAPDDSTDALKKFLEKIPELRSSEILTVIALDGSADTYCDIPQFRKTLTNDKGEEFEVQCGGFGAKFQFNAQLGEASGSYGAPSLQMVEKNDQLLVKNVHGDFNSHLGMKGLWVGSMTFSIESIEALDKGEPAFNLASFGMQAESGFAGETVNGSIRLGFDKLDAGGLGLGPVSMEFQARKLDADVLSRFERMAPDIRKKAAGESGDDADAMDAFVRQTIFDLLAKSPEFEMKQLKMRTDKGDLSGMAKVAFSGLADNLSGNILAILGSIDANAELSVSEALFFFIAENVLHDGSEPDAEKAAKHRAGEIAKGLLAENIMVRENGAFKSGAVYKHGKLIVNGRKMDFSGLLGSLSAE